MAFFVEVADQTLQTLHTWLTPEGFDRVRDWIVATLETCSDSFRTERRNRRPGAEGPSPYFEVTHIFPDGGRLYRVRFVVNDAFAVHGVLRIVFIDCDAGGEPP
jgi:hypothetical protein